MLKKKILPVVFLLIIGLIGVVLLVKPGGPAAENAQREAAVQLLAPGGQRIIEVERDLTDTSQSKIQVGQTAEAASFNGDVRDLPQVGPSEKGLGVEFEFEGSEVSNPDFIDPVRQGRTGMDAISGPDQSFAGLDLSNWGAGWPPDTQGDVGPNHYVQAVNTSIGIYNKTGTRLAAFTFDTLFGGTGTPCDNSNNGDPVVLYDNVSGRFIVSDFAWNSIQNGPYYECIAVSKTSDPVSGGWWFYGLRADDASHPWLNDYPKMGVWHDGIYMTANMFDCLTSTCSSASYKGVRLWALNRDDLINGNPITYQYGDLGTAYFSLIPSNAKVDIPAAGTPNYLMTLQTTSSVYTWKLSIDWNNANNSVLTGPFATSVPSFSTISSINQPGSPNLDSLGDRLMVQLQYSEASGTPALWTNHTVASGGVAGVRWYEFRNLAGTPNVHQASTYQPDSLYRWMGSVAVDSQGNMAVGYSATNNSVNPQIRYAGRLATDPLNSLAQGEATLIAGTGSQLTYSRWGDYSAMTIDVDGCTFWYTTEYYISTGTNWQTRIGSFSFPGCGGVTPTDTPVPTATNTPLPTATNTPGPTATNTPVPTATNTPVPTDTPPPPTATPGATSLHVGDLDGTSINNGSTWTAVVTILVVDNNGTPVQGATVSGNWSNGASGSSACVTNSSGICEVSQGNIAKKIKDATFTVSGITHASLTYNPAANTDPDGDSNGTTIVVTRA